MVENMSGMDSRRAVAEVPACRLSDQALVQEIAKGNQAALRSLAERHQRRVYKFALRYVGDASHAEDVVNETFFAVWQQAAAFQNRSAVGTWVLGIARFRALSLRQRLRETAEPLDDEIATNLPDPALGPDAVLERSNLTSVLRACLHALPLEQARLIDLVYLNEKPIREAARTIGIPLNTVKSRMFQARKKLAVLLSNAGIEPAPAGRGAW
jgi:RNA polymerase sigma-70 factor, ECF subfamily